MSMHIHNRLTDARGFTIAEVLIAAVIITLAFVALATVVPIAGYGVQEGYQVSTATFLADQKLEQSKNLPWVGSPANDCVGISASSTAAPTVPGGSSCTNGGTNIAAGGAVTWLADEASVTNFPGYSRSVRGTDCGTGGGGARGPGSRGRPPDATLTYTPGNATRPR